MAECSYTIDGKQYSLPEFKAFLADGGIDTLYPDGAYPWVEKEAVKPASLIESHDAIDKRIAEGKITADEMRSEFEKLVKNGDAAMAELSKFTKAELEKRIRAYIRPDAKKADLVEDAYETMITDYWIGDSTFSYTIDFRGKETAIQAKTKKVRQFLSTLTDEAIQNHAEEIKQAKAKLEEERKAAIAGMDNPQTLNDYYRLMKAKMAEGLTYDQARMSLSQEQRAKMDEMAGEESRGDRKARADQQKTDVRATVTTTSGDIIETKHTKTGEDLFVVKAADRVERETYNQWNATAKRLGGWYSSYRGAGAVPGFQFKTRENAEAFLQYLGGDAAQAKEAIQERRDAYADDKSQTAVERLTEMADRLEGKGEESLNQDRKANTTRRAGMAANAIARAESDIALAKTMRNIAKAIGDGKAKFLDRVRQKTQVEMLQTFVNVAQGDKIRAQHDSYGEQLKRQGEKPDMETADYAKFPDYTAFRSDLAKLGRALSENEGTKKLGKQLLSVADDVDDAYLKWAKENMTAISTFRTSDGLPAIIKSKLAAEESIYRSGYKGTAIPMKVKEGWRIVLSPAEVMKRGIWKGDHDKRITLKKDFGAELVEKVGKAARRNRDISVPWYFETAYDKQKRLAAMGIETRAEFLAALREFISLSEAPKEADKIKEMERAMIGRANDGLDFFPTPASVAEQMVETANIEEGMSVLEPSAGMGHIAERIREAGIEPDVVELSNARKELLEAKGFNVVGRDFMETEGKYDRVIMNPPFGDRRDAAHVQHAYDLLKPGGRLVAIMGEGVFFGQDKKAQAFRDWLEEHSGTDEKLEEGTFKDPSLPVQTGVNARLVVIDKPMDAEAQESSIKYSKSSAEGAKFAAKALEELAKDDEFFRFPISPEVNIEDVFKDIFPIARYRGWQANKNRHMFALPPTKTTGAMPFYIYEKNGKVWIDVSQLETGSGGAAIYFGVGNYARNTHQVFVGDPDGLSKDATIRRTANMLSMALRFGDTSFMEPAKEQAQGYEEDGIDPLEWKKGDDEANVVSLIKTFIGNIHNQFPEIKDARYDFETGEFIDPAGDVVEDGFIDRIRKGRFGELAKRARAGATTTRQAILVQSLISSEGSKRPDILGQLLHRDRSLAEGGIDKLFSRNSAKAGSTVEQVKSWLPRRVLPMLEAGKLKIVQSVEDLPANLRGAGNALNSIFYHGSGNNEKITAIKKADWGYFDGVFASGRMEVAKSHGDLITAFDIDDDKIASSYDLESAASYSELTSLIRDKYPAATDEQIDNILYPAIVEDKNVYRMDARAVQEATERDDIGEASWDLQNERGYVAQKLGFDAVEMDDEHGTSYLIPYGSNAKILNDVPLYAKLAGIQGLYDNKTDQLYLVADMLDKGNLSAVLSHELYHRAESQDPQLKAAIQRFEADFNRRFELASKGIGSEIDKAAYQSVKNANTPLKDQQEEFRAYMVSQWQKSPQSMPERVRKAIQDLIAAIRVFLIRSGLDMGFIKSLTPADLAAMSRYGSKVARLTASPLASVGAKASTKPIPETLTIDGKERPTRNSNGQPIAQTEEGIRNFWRWFSPSPRQMQSGLSKAGIDSLERNAKLIADFLESNPIGTELGGSINIPRTVFLHMSKVVENDKILDSIIRSIPVDVMDFLRSKQISAKELLHNPSMLENMLSIKPASNVPLRVEPSSIPILLVRMVANAGAKITGLTNRTLEINSAMLADTINPVFGAHINNSPNKDLSIISGFGDSKVVDDHGRPMVVYHGTTSDFSEFNKKESRDHLFYASEDKTVAGQYSRLDGGNVMPIYLRIANPVNDFDRMYSEYQDHGGIDGYLEDNDFDGYIDNAARKIAFVDKSQAKSAIGNNGDFNPGNPDIRYSMASDIAEKYAPEAALQIGDHLSSSKTFNWWHNTVGSQFHKAIKDKHFGKVFNRSMQFEQDVAKFANEDADIAPSLLPKGNENPLKIPSEIKAGYQRNKDAKAVGGAIFDTTLQDKPLTEQELTERGLTEQQKAMYREFFQAVNASLDNVAKSEMFRVGRSLKLEQAPSDLSLKDTAKWYAEQSPDDANLFNSKAEAIQKLKKEGYAPLMRFGQFTVNVQKENAKDPEFFGMFETQAEANKMARIMREEYPDAKVSQGVMSQEDWKMFRGVTPESMEVFAKMMGVEQDEAFQTYLKSAVVGRSALKRLIHRKKIKGFDMDVPRVLATFITSNARMASKNYHMGELINAIAQIPKEKGDVRDEAVKLYEFVQNPQTKGAWARNLLFTWYLGGSVASAMVNLTQTFTTTLPFLHQFGETKQVTGELAKAMKLAANPASVTGDLARALKLADEEGVTAPHELHMLYGESMRNGMFAPEWLRPLGKAWGSLFSAAEAYNRRVAFITAYQIAKTGGEDFENALAEMERNGMQAPSRDPFAFASDAVNQTQFVYSKSSRPNWARSTVGSTVFTFKMFMVNYLEFVSRLPKQEQAIALGVLVLFAGLGGLPGEDDADDIIDTIGQAMGYNTNAKAWKERVLNDMIGKSATNYAMRGLSSALPFDISSRLGVSNVVPGTSILKKSEKDKSRDVMEFAGASGALAARVVEAFDAAESREGALNFAGAVGKSLAPKAIQDAYQAVDMYQTGQYRDVKGRKVTDTTASDALFKLLGLQPNRVADVRRPERLLNQDITLAKEVEADIAGIWAEGVYEKDSDKIAEAKSLLKKWNERNPDTPIGIKMNQIVRRVKQMRQTSEQRMIKTTPKEMRRYAQGMLSD